MNTTDAARLLASRRRSHRGGRPRKPAACPKCGAKCDSTRMARAHCVPDKHHKIGIPCQCQGCLIYNRNT